MEDNQDSTGCIKCHMPYTRGGVEKTNKKGREEHRAHDFPGIHNSELIKERDTIDKKVFLIKIDENYLIRDISQAYWSLLNTIKTSYLEMIFFSTKDYI